MNRVPSDRELTLIAMELHDVVRLGAILRISTARTEQCRLNHPYDVSAQVSAVLQMWKREHGSSGGASVKVLVDALERARLLSDSVKHVIVTDILQGRDYTV